MRYPIISETLIFIIRVGAGGGEGLLCGSPTARIALRPRPQDLNPKPS